MAEEKKKGGKQQQERTSLKANNINSFAKGLSLDLPTSAQPEGSYRFALNVVNEDIVGKYGFVINEAGNYKCIDLGDDDEYSWHPIGSVYLEDDSAVIFLASTSDAIPYS